MNTTSEIEKINENFKLPIYYNKEKQILKKNIINDLELTTTVDPSCNPIYSFYFNNENDLSKKLIEQTAEYYTTDVHFLKENQLLLKKYVSNQNKYTEYSKNYGKMIEIWNEIKTDTGFREKYYYMDWEMLEFLNRSELFLQVMSIYNMASPIVSLFVPIIILIIPFFIIKLKGLNITIKEYIEVLKFVVQTNAIGKLFTTFNDVSTNDKVYLLVSAAFYLFSIYQNILVCIRFNSNMVKIHEHIKEINHYLSSTISTMENYLHHVKLFETQAHKEFNSIVNEKMNILIKFRNKIENITDYKITNYKKMVEIGFIMKCFYEFYDDKEYNDAFMYSFGFNGYIDCIEGLQKNIVERKINYTDFTDGNKKTVIKNNYYACLKDSTPIKNTIKLKKNMIITGPNASGKTTILKSTLINIIVSQQFGCGFYGSAKISPFTFIHCYLNIPDTSGRDSLFQAEARRCKEILDIINDNKKETHFCVFDELYSGTNPDEAVTSAKAFMEYIVKNKKVSCLLTTHFVKVCKKLDKNENVMNCHMETEKTNNKLYYKYKLKPGISEIKGGISVLTEMNYPKEILENTEM
jgi:hypothetical protein